MAHLGAIHAASDSSATAPGTNIVANRLVVLSGASTRPALQTASATDGGSALPATLAHCVWPVAAATRPGCFARAGLGWSPPGPAGTTGGAILAGVPCAASCRHLALLAFALGALRLREVPTG